MMSSTYIGVLCLIIWWRSGCDIGLRCWWSLKLLIKFVPTFWSCVANFKTNLAKGKRGARLICLSKGRIWRYTSSSIPSTVGATRRDTSQKRIFHVHYSRENEWPDLQRYQQRQQLVPYITHVWEDDQINNSSSCIDSIRVLTDVASQLRYEK